MFTVMRGGQSRVGVGDRSHLEVNRLGLSGSPGAVNWRLAQAGHCWEEAVKKAFASLAEGNDTTNWVTSGSGSFDPGGSAAESSSPLTAVFPLLGIHG